jgi:putative pyruvate formate lyase activating enzyme
MRSREDGAMAVAWDGTPSYLRLDAEELAERSRQALALLGEERCRVCPRLCKVGRLADQKGLCAIGRQAVVASYFPHFGEENCLRGWNGSGTIFFSGCNLRCVFCVPPDTLVATDTGPRPIDRIFEEGSDEVVLGEGYARRPTGLKVYTRTGELAPASRVFRHRFEGELIKLKPLSAPEVRLTPNHGVFAAHRSDPTRIEKVPAGSLTREHYLVVPKRAVGSGAIGFDVREIIARHVSRPVHARARRVDEHRLASALLTQRSSSRELGAELGYHPTYVRRLRAKLRQGLLDTSPSGPRGVQVEDGRVRFAGEHRPGIPAFLPLDGDLAWLLGLYCAEGHVRSDTAHRPNSHRLVFSLGPHETGLARRTSDRIRAVIGIEPCLMERRTTPTVEVGKTSLALFFELLCGTGADRKQVPTPVFHAEEGTVRSFLEGYLAGDGATTPTHVVANTVSPALAHGLYEVGLRLGVLPSIHGWVPSPRKAIEGRTVRQSPLWIVKFKRDRLNGSVGPHERTRWRDMGNHFLVPLHRIEREAYAGDVYNLEVDHPTHSYLVPAVAVANCQNHDISWEVQGERVTPARLAQMMLELQARGCHNINWVTPEHVVPQILEAVPLAVAGGLRLPIIYNTSSYDSLDSLRLMEGIVDVYMPDFKVWSQQAARRYLRRPEYAEVARQAVKEMHRQVGPLELDQDGLAQRGLLLRHLVMPGMLEETEAILRFVAEELGPDTYVDLMAQYYPAGLVGGDGRDGYLEINRHLYRDEYLRAVEMGRDLGLRLDARSVASAARLRPADAPS